MCNGLINKPLNPASPPAPLQKERVAREDGSRKGFVKISTSPCAFKISIFRTHKPHLHTINYCAAIYNNTTHANQLEEICDCYY